MTDVSLLSGSTSDLDRLIVKYASPSLDLTESELENLSTYISGDQVKEGINEYLSLATDLANPSLESFRRVQAFHPKHLEKLRDALLKKETRLEDRLETMINNPNDLLCDMAGKLTDKGAFQPPYQDYGILTDKITPQDVEVCLFSPNVGIRYDAMKLWSTFRGSPDKLEKFLGQQEEPVWSVRIAAAEAFNVLGGSPRTVLEHVQSGDLEYYDGACDTLRADPEPLTRAANFGLFFGEDWQLCAIRALSAHVGEVSAISMIDIMFNQSENDYVRTEAIDTFFKLGGVVSAMAYIFDNDDNSYNVRSKAIKEYVEHGGSPYDLLRLFEDKKVAYSAVVNYAKADGAPERLSVMFEDKDEPSFMRETAIRNYNGDPLRLVPFFREQTEADCSAVECESTIGQVAIQSFGRLKGPQFELDGLIQSCTYMHSAISAVVVMNGSTDQLLKAYTTVPTLTW